MKKQLTILSASALLGLSSASHAVENLNALPIWFESNVDSFGLVEQLNSIDFYPGTTGTELIGFTETITGEDLGSTARTVWKQRIQVRNASTGAQISQFTFTSKSEPYPDDDASFDYLCNDSFSGTLEPDKAIPDCDLNLSAGIAETSGGTRYLVIGTSVIIDYFDGVSTDDVADVYKLHVYNLTTNNLAWAKSWKLETPGGAGGDWELDVGLSGVGDYINADGTDELRVAQYREQGGNLRWRYQYYNITTGALIDTVAFSVPIP